VEDLDLDAAWRKVLADAWSDDLPDILRLNDFKLTWNKWKSDLEGSLADGSYSPEHPRLIERPKDGLMVRPLALMHPRDRVVYWALVNRIAEAIDGVLSPHVFSARLAPKGKRLTGQISAWTRFQNAGRALYDEYDYAYLLSTDVTSYFEYVDTSILATDLLSLPPIPARYVHDLQGFLSRLTEHTAVWGLPQGHEASAILGNFYLLPIDRVLLRYDVKFIRYQDDIKVFAASPAILRLALREVARAMRARRLSLSVHKTRILEGPEILQEFEDARKDAIQYGMEAGAEDTDVALRSLFDDAVASEDVKARDVRFAVYRLGKLGDPYAIPWILGHFAELPYLASHLVNYLGLYFEEYPEIESRVREYLLDPAQNLYPWAELQMMRMFSCAASISDETWRCVWQVVVDANKDALVREHATRCIGLHARAGDAATLRDLLPESDNTWLSRALIVAYTEAGGRDRPDNALLGSIARYQSELAATCEYLRSPAKLPRP